MKVKNGGTGKVHLGVFGSLAALLVMTLPLTGAKNPTGKVSTQEEWCVLSLAAGNSATWLGPMDLNAGYHGLITPVTKGETLVFRGHFPRARYMTIVLYDQNFKVIDSLTDFQIQPLAGANPFTPGVERSGPDLGEFEVKVLMTAPPPGPRPANTLYAGLDVNGKPNKILVFGYRVYLPDQGLGQRDRHPLALYGGVPAPRFKMLNAQGQTYCPDPAKNRFLLLKLMSSVLWANRQKIVDSSGFLGLGDPQSPPVWINPYSREESRQANTYVGNEDTAYLATPISEKLGELLVLRWKPARTPVETWRGQPFPPVENTDMRYFSISFAALDKKRGLFILTEKTVADVDIPLLPDGTAQLVVGFGGRTRPEGVPSEQWVGLQMKEGIMIVRNILVNPQYAGDFGQVPAGPIIDEHDQYTPGGVYCSVADFLKNPELGLSRWKKP